MKEYIIMHSKTDCWPVKSSTYCTKMLQSQHQQIANFFFSVDGKSTVHSIVLGEILVITGGCRHGASHSMSSRQCS